MALAERSVKMAITYESVRTHLLPIYILGVDINKVQEPVDRPNGYPSYQLSLCVDGSGIFIDENNKEHVISKGDLFFFSPNTPHRYKAVTDEWKLPYIVFTGQASGNIVDYLEFGKSFVLKNIDEDDYNKISAMFNRIYSAYFSDIELRYARTSSMLYSLLVLIAETRRSKAKIQDELSMQLAPAMNYIRRHTHEDISVDDLAKIVGVSSGRLSVLFKQAFGLTPAQAVRKYKLEQAKHLMDSRPDMKVKEISERCGFSSVSYFVTAFKKEFGISPTDYKNNFSNAFFW